jgi:hypothetical protein
MKKTLGSMVIAFILMATDVGWQPEGTAWAKACPEHQAAKVSVPDLEGQTQQVAIPPLTQQRAQTTQGSPIWWRKGIVSAFIVLFALALGLFLRLRRERFARSLIPQLLLPYSNSAPLLVTSAG